MCYLIILNVGAALILVSFSIGSSTISSSEATEMLSKNI